MRCGRWVAAAAGATRAVVVMAALGAALGAGGCRRQSGLEVTIDGPITGVRRVELTVTTAGASDVLSFPRAGVGAPIELPQTAGVRFTRGESGIVTVDARVLDAGSGVIGEGSGTATLLVGETVTLFIALTPVANAVCGDLVVTPPETCDDGNSVADDGCADCQLECGDGVVGANEVCDDGNRAGGDACSTDCQMASAHIETVAGGPGASPDGAAAATAQLIGPLGIRVRADGAICWAEAYRIRCMNGTTVETLVGNGTSGYSGDGGPALDAQIWSPVQFDWDAAGNLYFTDGYYHAIRRVDAATGAVALWAGDPYTGDHVDGDRLDARFLRPYGLVVGPADEIYVSELLGHTVRRIDAAGVVTTIAGTPGAPGGAGNGGPAGSALLDGPAWLALNPAGDVLFLADTGNFQVRRISLTPGVISAAAGSGLPGAPLEGGTATTEPLLSVGGVDVASDGTLRFVMGGQEVWRVQGATLARDAFLAHGAPCVALGGGGDGGDPLAACIENAGALTTNGAEVLVTDAADGRVRRYIGGAAGSTMTLAGRASAAPANADPHDVKLYGPSGIAAEGADLILLDNVGARVLRATGGTEVTTVAGDLTWGFAGDGAAAAGAVFSSPFGLIVHSMLGILVADLGNARVRGISSGIITTVAGDGTTLFVDGAPATMTGLNGPAAVADDGAGGFYVAEFSGAHLLHVSMGNVTLVAGGGASTGDGLGTAVALSGPLGMTMRPDGKLLFVDGTRVRKYDPANMSVTTIAGLATPTVVVPGPDVNGDGGPATGASFLFPTDVAVAMDGTTTFVADRAAGAIRAFAEGDVILTLAGAEDDFVGFSADGTQPQDAELNGPWRLWSDPATGDLYEAELGNQVVRRIVFP